MFLDHCNNQTSWSRMVLEVGGELVAGINVDRVGELTIRMDQNGRKLYQF